MTKRQSVALIGLGSFTLGMTLATALTSSVPLRFGLGLVIAALVFGGAVTLVRAGDPGSGS